MNDRMKGSYLRLIQESNFRDSYSFGSLFTNVQESLVSGLWGQITNTNDSLKKQGKSLDLFGSRKGKGRMGLPL